ncbi:MAG: hypothetical protein RR272_02105 [Synergistaceae bacterium]
MKKILNKIIRNAFYILLITVAISLLVCYGKYFFLENILPIIKYYDNVMRGYVSNFTTSVTPWKLFTFWGIALFYGFLHSAAPGHGKAIITTYFLNHEEKVSSAVILAGMMSLVHTLVSIAFSLLIVTALNGMEELFNIEIRGFLVGISGLLIMSLGLFLFFHEVSHHKHHHDHCNKSCSMSKYSSPAMLGVISGLVPCPITIFLITFSFTNGIPLVGLIAVLGLSMGMFLLVAFIGVAVVLGRGKIIHWLECLFSEGVEKISSVLELISAVVIALIGFVMALSLI